MKFFEFIKEVVGQDGKYLHIDVEYESPHLLKVEALGPEPDYKITYYIGILVSGSFGPELELYKLNTTEGLDLVGIGVPPIPIEVKKYLPVKIK